MSEKMKIGRNEKCPCGSGKKFKKCCGLKERVERPVQQKMPDKQEITLEGAITNLQAIAAAKQEIVEPLGVFILYSDKVGDAWVLETTEKDCVQVAKAGEPLEVPLEETRETIVMDWSHRFSFKQKKFFISAYRTKEEKILENAPAQRIFAAFKRLQKKLTPEIIEKVHVTG